MALSSNDLPPSDDDPDRHGYHHGNLRAVLVATARQLIEEQGPQRWSLREAARRSNVSASAPYRHFEDKAELLEAVAAQAFETQARRYESAVPDGVFAVGAALLDFALEQPGLYALAFRGPDSHTSPQALATYKAFVRSVSIASGAEDWRSEQSIATAHAVWAAAHGSADLVARGYFSAEHGRETLSRLVNGLIDTRDQSDGRD